MGRRDKCRACRKVSKRYPGINRLLADRVLALPCHGPGKPAGLALDGLRFPELDSVAVFIRIQAAARFHGNATGNIFPQQDGAVHVDVVEQWQ